MYVKVLGVDIAVFGQIKVLLCHEDAFFEDPFVNLLAISFGDEPLTFFVSGGEPLFVGRKDCATTYMAASSL